MEHKWLSRELFQNVKPYNNFETPDLGNSRLYYKMLRGQFASRIAPWIS